MSLAALAGCLAPSTATAHLVSSGVGPFYDGMAHFFVTPEDLVVVMALALFGGLSGRPAARALVLTLPLAWLVGAGLGIHDRAGLAGPWVPAAGMLIVGLLVSLNPKVPVFLPALLAGGLGLLHGILNGRAMAVSDTPFLAAAGIVSALGLVALLLGALAASLHVPWHRIAARALGSWTAAIGLLALAWRLRPTP